MKKLILPFILLIVSISSQAATLIMLENTDNTMPDKIVVKDGKVLMTSPDKDGRLIFDTHARSMIVINDSKREYMVIDEAYMVKIGGMLNSMKSMMQNMLDQVPEKERLRLEEVLGTSLSDNTLAIPNPPQILKTGKKKSINSISCEVVLFKEDGVTTTEVCVATQQATGIKASDYDTLMKMGKISNLFIDQFSQIAGEYAGELSKGATVISQIDGIPIEVINGENRSIMSSIMEQIIANSVFGLAGYRQVDPMLIDPGQM